MTAMGVIIRFKQLANGSLLNARWQQTYQVNSQGIYYAVVISPRTMHLYVSLLVDRIKTGTSYSDPVIPLGIMIPLDKCSDRKLP